MGVLWEGHSGGRSSCYGNHGAEGRGAGSTPRADPAPGSLKLRRFKVRVADVHARRPRASQGRRAAKEFGARLQVAAACICLPFDMLATGLRGKDTGLKAGSGFLVIVPNWERTSEQVWSQFPT